MVFLIPCASYWRLSQDDFATPLFTPKNQLFSGFRANCPQQVFRVSPLYIAFGRQQVVSVPKQSLLFQEIQDVAGSI